MSPRQPDPAARSRLVEAAARLLAEGGPSSVSARRVAADAGTSTMAVYTHFGSMDDLLAEIWREGFTRFGAALEQPATTADPVADWMAQGWGYRSFVLEHPHLYTVMFREGLEGVRTGCVDDQELALATFTSLLERIDRCVAAERWTLEDVPLAGEVVWATVHGLALLELSGYHGPAGRDPAAAYAEAMLRLSIGFGDAPERSRASSTRARARARRAGQAA
jgi:AcrR family transcriptional regulator